MTDQQVNALAQACRVGAMNNGELDAIIDRHHAHEKRFINTYAEALVCGFRDDSYTGPFTKLVFDEDPTPSAAG